MTSRVERFAIGIDIGATKIASVLISEAGTVIDSLQAPTPVQQGAQAVLDQVAHDIVSLVRQRADAVIGIGIGSPGKVDSGQGIVCNAVNLRWTEVPLKAEITSRIKQHGWELPVWIQKDTNLNALGEYYFGACRGCTDFVYIGVGSGLGAGVISGDRLVTGADWYAADIGHLSIDPDGPRCACGGRGCAELVASGPGLVRVTKQLLADSSSESVLPPQEELSAAEILEAARQGDLLAQDAVAQVGRGLGIVMSACTVILNPSRFVVGGGLGLAGFDLLLPGIRQEIERRTIPEHRSQMRIVRSQVKSSAIGAACLVWYAQSGKTLQRASEDPGRVQ
jgi:glucokinase